MSWLAEYLILLPVQLQLYLSNGGVRTGCGQRQCTPSRRQVTCDETAEFLKLLSFPAPYLSVQPVDGWARSKLSAAAGGRT